MISNLKLLISLGNLAAKPPKSLTSFSHVMKKFSRLFKVQLTGQMTKPSLELKRSRSGHFSMETSQYPEESLVSPHGYLLDTLFTVNQEISVA